MSPAATRRLLWLVFLFTVPVPYTLVHTGWVPAARLLFLGALVLAVLVVEGGAGSVGVFAAFLVGQAVLHTGLLYVGARLVARVLASVAPRLRTLLLVGIVAALLGLSLTPVYRTPLSSTGERASLLEAFD
jgi:hypothetical protein